MTLTDQEVVHIQTSRRAVRRTVQDDGIAMGSGVEVD